MGNCSTCGAMLDASTRNNGDEHLEVRDCVAYLADTVGDHGSRISAIKETAFPHYRDRLDSHDRTLAMHTDMLRNLLDRVLMLERKRSALEELEAKIKARINLRGCTACPYYNACPPGGCPYAKEDEE